MDAEWERLPEGPLEGRDEPVAAWTGSLLLVWGGRTYTLGGSRFHADGAAFDPGNGEWSPMAASPLEPRAAVRGAWTGRELVVWGGMGRSGFLADGAAYDPERRAWRPLPPSPLSPRGSPALVWTGTELFVAGGYDNTEGLPDGARYDPAADRWAPLPDVPLRPMPWGLSLTGGLTDAGPVVWTSESDMLQSTLAARFTGSAWEPLPPMPRTPNDERPAQMVTVVTSLSGVTHAVVGDWGPRGLRSSLLRLVGEGWEDLGRPPWSPVGDWTAAVVGDDLYLVDSGGAGAVFDGRTGTWLALPRLRGADGRVVLQPAGEHLVALATGGGGTSGALRAWSLPLPDDVVPPHDHPHPPP
jgi:hypothetical protein